MIILNWMRFLLAAIMILGGLTFYSIQFIGLFRFKNALNRLHAGALGDTLGSGLMLLGSALLYGISFTTLKLFAIIIFLWFTTPVASHMVAKFEVLSKANINKACRKKTLQEWKEEKEK